MPFLGCSLLWLVGSIATLVWALRMPSGRERDRYMVQAPIAILIGVGLTVAAIAELRN